MDFDIGLPSLKVTAKAPENQWLEDENSFWVSAFEKAYFQGRNC